MHEDKVPPQPDPTDEGSASPAEGAGRRGLRGMFRVARPDVARPSNEEVGAAASRASRLWALGWWHFRTGPVRHRVAMWRIYSSTVRPPKRPK